MKNEMIKNTFILTMITVIAGVLLGFVYEITKEPIAAAKEAAKQKAFIEVFSDAESFEAYEGFDIEKASTVISDAGFPNNTISEVVVAKGASENLGYVATVVSHDGYGGDITITMGVTNEGLLNGISVLSISETAGLGMKAADAEFTNKFAEKNIPVFSVTKTGATDESQIDAISGATITTTAMTNAVNAGLAYISFISGGGVNE